jgi:hypothetical protein
MPHADMPTHKRSFNQSGLGDEDGLAQQSSSVTKLSSKEPKIVHLSQDMDATLPKPGLGTLPTEILCQIASHLSTTELLSLRLANRTIEVQLFNDFAAYYFAKKQFMLTPESLQCLVDISLHPKLSTVLEHVIISLDLYRSHTLYRSIDGQASDVPGLPAGPVLYRRGAYDQAAFLASGRDGRLLTQAFRNLPNLKTVGLRDFNSGRRWRDGPAAQWRAYGATTVLQQTGQDLLVRNLLPGRHNYLTIDSALHLATRAMTVVLQALGEACARPESIEVLAGEAHALQDHAFHVPSFLAPTVIPVLAGLKSLLLAVVFHVLSIPAVDRFPLGPSTTAMPDFALERFLSLTPELTHLRLNFFEGAQPINETHRFLSKVTASGPELLPKLSRLDIGMLYSVSQDDLASVVERWRGTLTEVSFWKVALFDTPVQLAALDPQAKPNRWAELLVRLRKTVPGLERITVGCLRQKSRIGMQSMTLKVPDPVRGGRAPPSTRVYRREDMRDLKAFRATLEQEIIFLWGDSDSEHDDDDSDGGSGYVVSGSVSGEDGEDDGDNQEQEDS